MRKLVVGALIGGTALFGGGAAAQAFDDGGDVSADSGYSDAGGFDSGYSDVGGFDSGYSDVGSYDSGDSAVGSSDSSYSDTGTYDSVTDAGSDDSGSSDVGSYDSVTDAGSYDTGPTDTSSYDVGYSDTGVVDTWSSDPAAVDTTTVDTTTVADPVATETVDPVATTDVAEPVATDVAEPTAAETVAPAPAEPAYGTTVTAVDEVTTEVGGEDGTASGDTIAGTPTDHVDPTEGLTDDPSATHTTTHQVGTETETVAPTTVDGWFSEPEAATSTTTTFTGTETVTETEGSTSAGWSVDDLDVTETTTTVAPVDGEGWTTTQVDREEHGPGWGLDLDPTDGTLEGSVTYQGEISSSYDAGQDFGSTSVETGYDLTAAADATAEATLDADSVGIDLGLEATAEAEGHVGATFGEDTFAETELTGTASVEGEVQAGIDADLGLTEGSADVGLFGGVSGTIEGEAEIAGVSGTIGVTGSVGAGVGAGFSYSAEDGVYSIGGHVHGAAVFGGGISGGITIDTNELAESASQAWDAVSSTVGSWFGGRD
jgi:hypothetical protein